MQTVHLTDLGLTTEAVHFPQLPENPDELKALSDVLMGQHEYSGRLLEPASEGSALSDWGAEQYLVLTFAVPPRGGHGVGGIYGVMNWVNRSLEPAMPEGWGAACESAMFPLIGTDETHYYVERDLRAVWHAGDTGSFTAYAVAIGVVDRSKSKIQGAYLNDDLDAPVITPVTVR